MKRILLAIFTFAAIVILFQNCSVPNQGSLSSSSSTIEGASGAQLVSLLAIRSMSPQIFPNDNIQLIASGGYPPYQYSILEGTGSIDQGSGVFRAPSSDGSVVVQLTDSHSDSVRLNLTIGQNLWTAARYQLLPVHLAKSAPHAVFYSTSEAEARKQPGFSYTGVLFNLFQAASSPRTIYLCYNTAIDNCFLYASATCGGHTSMGPLGVLESVATNVVATPVYRCVRTSGAPMNLTTLTPEKDCIAKKGYKVDVLLGYTR